MPQRLCPSCLNFNKNSTAHCTYCNQRLRTSWGHQSVDLSRSPFSAPVVTSPTLWSGAVSYSSQLSRAQTLRYSFYFVALLTLGSIATYTRLHPPASEESEIQNRPQITYRIEPAPPLRPPAVSQPFSPSISYPSSSEPDISTIAQGLKLNFRYSVPSQLRQKLEGHYQVWKNEHQKSASEVDSYLDLYAPDAKIVVFSATENVDWLRKTATQVRNGGTFRFIVDRQPLQWRANSSMLPSRVEMLTLHRYKSTNGAASEGQRRLVWAVRGGEWKIIEDDFPPFYSQVVQPVPKQPMAKQPAPNSPKS